MSYLQEVSPEEKSPVSMVVSQPSERGELLVVGDRIKETSPLIGFGNSRRSANRRGRLAKPAVHEERDRASFGAGELDQTPEAQPRESVTEADAEDEANQRIANLADPVHAYLKEAALFSVLSREEEVAACQRIEQAEDELKRVIHSVLVSTAKEYLAIAGNLLAQPPLEKFDRVVMPAKQPNREVHLRARWQIGGAQVRQLDEQLDAHYAWTEWSRLQNQSPIRCNDELAKLNQKSTGKLRQIRLHPKSGGRASVRLRGLVARKSPGVRGERAGRGFEVPGKIAAHEAAGLFGGA